MDTIVQPLKPKRKCSFTAAHMAKIGKRGGDALKRKRGKKFFSKISNMRANFRGGRKPVEKALHRKTV